MENNIFDLIIVGGGPAGASAAVYAARKRLKSVLILKEWGGQSIVSDDIQNWIGTPHISGADLAKNLENHVKEYAGEFLEIKVGHLAINTEIVTRENNEEIIKITLDNGENILGTSLLITTGSKRRKLTIPGAEEFEHKGLTYCATCDGPIFAGQDVVVIGGGNAGFESAAQLLAYAKSVTLLSRSEPRADKITIEKLKQDPNFKLIVGATPKEVFGETFVNAISYTDQEGKEVKLEATAIFVEIGPVPATEWSKNVVELDEISKIKIDPWTNRASQNHMIWAAGDATNILYHQNNIASGAAVNAVEDIYKTIKTK